MNIELIKVNKNERSKLEKLLQLYLHDLSLYFPLDFDSEKCEYDYDLDKYFDNDFAYFIKSSNDILGFILIDINGNKYDGDNPKELSDTDANSKKVKDYLIRLSGASSELKSSNTKETFEKYFLVKPFIDYFLVMQILYHYDGFYKNWIWLSYNGLQWTPSLYDVDSIFGQAWNGTHEIPTSDKNYLNADGACMGLPQLYAEEIKARYKELRNLRIFDADNIVGLLNKWLGMIGYNNLSKEHDLYPETPSYRDGGVSENWEMVYDFLSSDAYSSEKQYAIGDRCSYGGMIFKAKVQTQGVPPLTKTYSKNPDEYKDEL